ncbi:hypothetical protein GY45DRAFT_63102 [Cubamyces sp. BRFM 1775]|nr:hypothetical protein GY45DRAFT_63102 [Cubamyces sp. BRFM 1775]
MANTATATPCRVQHSPPYAITLREDADGAGHCGDSGERIHICRAFPSPPCSRIQISCLVPCLRCVRSSSQTTFQGGSHTREFPERALELRAGQRTLPLAHSKAKSSPGRACRARWQSKSIRTAMFGVLPIAVAIKNVEPDSVARVHSGYSVGSPAVSTTNHGSPTLVRSRVPFEPAYQLVLQRRASRRIKDPGQPGRAHGSQAAHDRRHS